MIHCHRQSIIIQKWELASIADIGWPAVGATSWMAPFVGLAIQLVLYLI